MGAQIPVRMCAKKRGSRESWKATSISVRRRGRRCCCPHIPPRGRRPIRRDRWGAGRPEAPPDPVSRAAWLSAGDARPGPAPVLQLTASVAPRQDLRINHGRVYLLVGCNMVCSLYAHGHLNLLRGRGRRRRHLGVAQHPQIARGRSHGRHQALTLAPEPGRGAPRAAQAPSVKAAIEVQGTGANGKSQTYLVSVVLTWR